MNKNIKLMKNENAFKVLSRAQILKEKGKNIINLGIGQPDFDPHLPVKARARNAFL